MRTGDSRLPPKREGVSSSAPKLWSLFSPIQRASMPIRSNNRAGAAGPRGERTGRGEPRRREGSAEAKHLRSARLRQANWYATGSVSASEAVQISANRGECVCVELSRNNGQLWRPLAINGRRSANVASSRARRPSDSATETGQLVGLRIRRALMPHAMSPPGSGRWISRCCALTNDASGRRPYARLFGRDGRLRLVEIGRTLLEEGRERFLGVCRGHPLHELLAFTLDRLFELAKAA